MLSAQLMSSLQQSVTSFLHMCTVRLCELHSTTQLTQSLLKHARFTVFTQSRELPQALVKLNSPSYSA